MAAQTTTLVFLDGGIVFTEHFSPEDVDDDQLPTGVWIVGTTALRAVCDVLDLVPPGRLKIETQPVDANDARRDLAQGRTVLDAAQQADLMHSRHGVAQLLQRSHAQIAEVPHHEWDCEASHGSPALIEYTWRDGRTNSLPSFCWAQEIPVADALPAAEGPSDYIESYYDEGADAEITMHRLREDVWVIVSGETDERVGLRLPPPSTSPSGSRPFAGACTTPRRSGTPNGQAAMQTTSSTPA